MTLDLRGKAAIVTGASKGIGRAVARDLAAAGAAVLICARDEHEVMGVAAELAEETGGDVRGIRCDVRQYEDVQRLVASAMDSFGRLDILINNAGVGVFAPVDEIDPDAWRQVLDTNLTGVYYACYESIPHMRLQGEAWIINIGSLAGKNPMPGGTAYNASKFGLLGFSEAMMLDVRHYGIRVSCIMPGSVETSFSGPGGHGTTDWKLRPEDISEMVVDLLSFHSRALPSRVEMRPSRPPRK